MRNVGQKADARLSKPDARSFSTNALPIQTAGLTLLGVNYRTAPVEVREDLSFTADEAEAFLRSFPASYGVSESAILSTCNRAEFYLVCAQPEAAQEWLLALRRLRPHARILRDDCTTYELQADEAAGHLFRVSAGLDSLILGDIHVLGQVKEAYQVARSARTVGPVLTRLFTRALRIGKHTRTATRIAHGGTTLGAAIRVLAKQHFPKGCPAQLLVIGAGTVAQDVALAFASYGGGQGGQILISNRTAARAQALAQKCHGRAVPWEQLAETIGRVDLVVAATTARQPVLTRTLIESGLSESKHDSLTRDSLILVDTGVPRNIDPQVASLAGVKLYDIDALQGAQQEAWVKRREEVPKVEALVENELAKWQEWQRLRRVEPTIKSLYAESEQVRQHVVGQWSRAPSHPEDNGLSVDEVEHLTQRLVKSLLNGPVHRLRQIARGSSASEGDLATASQILASAQEE